jgi:UDP-N-acetylglucosamine--N-acetylmuramyl-(pentapeptide) pyrophosphoryl-undecaprenol N-acetylglucosamine transferase
MRRSITELDRAAARGPARVAYELPQTGDVLLVSGGSQGAASINRAVQEARSALLAAGLSVLHVLGAKNMTPDDVRVVDPDTGAVYAPVPYVEQMEQAYAVADLMLGRCGAGTVMETAAVGLPAVFVPYPHGNGEQARNAALVVEAGGGLLLADDGCTASWVASEIPALLADAERRRGMRAALAGVARTDAAAVLAKRTLEVIG